MRTLLKIGLLCLIGLTAASSCKKKDKSTVSDPSKTDFDRKALLTNMGSTIIVPAYQQLSRQCAALDSAITDFTASPDAAKLTAVQALFKNAYRQWQMSSSYGMGPAEQEYLSENMNTFPTDTVKIATNLGTGSYNLNAIANLDAKGLPALDYLLFGLGSDNAARLAAYTTDAKAANRKQYLIALSGAVKTNCGTVLNNWASYITTFVNASGTDVGSSLGQLINAMDEDLEVLKNYKLGIPLGKQSMGIAYPAKVEAFYGGFSSQLAVLQLTALQASYLGKGSQGDGPGLDDYLIHLGASYNSGLLSDAIRNQFNAAIAKMQAVPDPLSADITQNDPLVNAAYVEIQKLVVLLKTDMPSALGVLITYEDNDGD